jgi:hypothetical protein
MTERINCKYCDKNIIKRNILRHQITKECRKKQHDLDIILKLKEHKCKYCNRNFNRLDTKNEHENNKCCDSKDILSILESKNEIIKQKDRDIITILEHKDKEINIYKIENTFLKSQLQIQKPGINLNSNNNTNITINNNININFNDIKDHLDKFNIHILSDHTALIHFIMNIFSNKVKLTNECKQIMSYYLNDKLINDIKCKTFLSNSVGQLTEISDKICKEGKNNKSLSDTIVKSACINNMLLNNISSEDGILKGVRKNRPLIMINEIIKFLKDNSLTEIKGV